MGPDQRQSNDDDVTVEVEVVEFAVHVRKGRRVDVGRARATSSPMYFTPDATSHQYPFSVNSERNFMGSFSATA
jgi:hypothetical protein